jgi:hypothetical protein
MSRTFLIAALAFFLVAVSVVHAGTSEEGLKFLEAKKLEEGVFALESGLLYKGMSEYSSWRKTLCSSALCDGERVL